VDSPLIGRRVKEEERGQKGIVLAVAHVAGGDATAGWQLLILNESTKMLMVANALNVQVLEPEGPSVMALDK
jgi:hypothetical protein